MPIRPLFAQTGTRHDPGGPAARDATRTRVAAAVAAVLSTGALACDAGSVFEPSSVASVEMAYLGDTVVAVAARVAPEVGVRHRGRDVDRPALRFLSSDTTILAVSPSGDSLIGRRRGLVTLTVRLESSLFPEQKPAIVKSLRVVIASLVVEPATVTLASLGDTLTLSAFALDADGEPLGGAQPRWRSSDPAVLTVDSLRGRVTARDNGTAEVLAVLDLDTAIVPVTVEQRLVRYTLSPAALVLDAIGARGTVTATGRDANGNALPGSGAIWGLRDSTVASITAEGEVTARRNGGTWIVATHDTMRDSVRLEVDQRAVSVVIAASDTVRIRSLNDAVRLEALGFDRLNWEVADDLPDWYSLDPSIVRVDRDRGVVQGIALGTGRVVATMDGAADTVIVRVTNEPAVLELLPASLTIQSVGDTVQLSATVKNGLGAVISDIPIAWGTPDPVILTVLNDGRVIANRTGTGRVIASAVGLADTSTIMVTNGPAVLDIVADTDTLRHIGATLTVDADIRSSRGDTLPNSSVTWTTDDPTVATVSIMGVVTARAVGETFIRASSGTLTDAILIVVRNDPATVVILNAVLDTLTARSQQLTYVAEVRNGSGALIANYPVSWSSTNGAAVTVSHGTCTSVGFGSALIIAEAGSVADTVTVVVRNPTLLHVDNSAVALPKVGTLARPFDRIQDAVNLADAGDTVFVRATSAVYAEPVSLGRRIFLLGDSAAYVASGRDPQLLPVILHDAGLAGITAITTAALEIRYFALRHAIEGPAIDARGAALRLDHVHVNPGDATRTGSGISLRDASLPSLITNSSVNAVRGYGILLVNAASGRIVSTDVTRVGALSGFSGAGIAVIGGGGNSIEGSRVSGTAGPQILLDTTASAVVTGNALAGRNQLVQVIGARGSTQILQNTFVLSLQPLDVFSNGSATDGRSGLELRSSPDVVVSGNRFEESGTAVMDAVRLIDVPPGSGGGARLISNVFTGGRYHVRSARSVWEMRGSRSTGALRPVVAEDNDVLVLDADTVSAASGGTCVEATGSAATVTIRNTLLSECTPATATTMGLPAVSITGVNASLTVTGSTFIGANQNAVTFVGRDLVARGNTLSGAGPRSVSDFAARGAMHIDAQNTDVVRNLITDYGAMAGIYLGDGTVKLDSNYVTRNGVGVRIGSFISITAVDNDWFDNDSAGMINQTSKTVTVPGNWWGDSRGPRRDAAPAATGDSAHNKITFDVVGAVPRLAGVTATLLRHVRGDGQSANRNSTFAKALTVRVVDAEGRAVAGTSVTFTVTQGPAHFGGNLKTRTVTSNSSGLAEVTLSSGGTTGQSVILVTASPPLNTLTLTATTR